MVIHVEKLVRLLKFSGMALLIALAIFGSSMLSPMPAMAGYHAPNPIAFGTMSNRTDAAAKEAEGKLESAYGEITGDTGHQVKGKAKQVQASAMNAGEDLKQGAKSVTKKIADAADNR